MVMEVVKIKTFDELNENDGENSEAVDKFEKIVTIKSM